MQDVFWNRPIIDRYRPHSFPWPVYEEEDDEEEEDDSGEDEVVAPDPVPKKFQFMEDWDLVGLKKGAYMSQTPQENQAELMQVTASVVTIAAALERRWAAEEVDEE